MTTSKAFSRTDMLLVATSKSKVLPPAPLYSVRETAIFRKFLPYSFENGKLFNPDDRYALIDANQRIFNILSKLDHTYVSMLCRDSHDISSQFWGKAKPVAAAMEILSGYALPESGLVDIYALKMGLLNSLSASISLLKPATEYAKRGPGIRGSPSGKYGKILGRYSQRLLCHFPENSSLLLYGSAARADAKPNDADFCAVVQPFNAESYSRHILYAVETKRTTQNILPLTFSIMPSSHFLPFALSDPDRKFARAGNSISGAEITVPVADENWIAGITTASVLHAALRLREALANWIETARNPNIIKARVNEPYYALESLKSIFGEPLREIRVKKASPGGINRSEAVGALIDSNMAMQEIIQQYADRIERHA